MIVTAFILGVVGVAGLVGVMCFGVYLAYRKPTKVETLTEGTYRVTVIGINKLTNQPQYQFELISEDAKSPKAEDAGVVA